MPYVNMQGVVYFKSKNVEEITLNMDELVIVYFKVRKLQCVWIFPCQS